ncbi:hypothetical protein [Falsibacillus albus]|uniref:Uncharacterized protein n=1 Tax=Falsibacillus albus TaxID=2478915 RepID=A0A3L7JUX0_9BACI|nr:hypothetical protein [Falsibacillus albus]RLQ94034.1 hypothetical protein D9X91_15480 [Falsibacillus albus]
MGTTMVGIRIIGGMTFGIGAIMGEKVEMITGGMMATMATMTVVTINIIGATKMAAQAPQIFGKNGIATKFHVSSIVPFQSIVILSAATKTCPQLSPWTGFCCLPSLPSSTLTRLILFFVFSRTFRSNHLQMMHSCPEKLLKESSFEKTIITLE